MSFRSRRAASYLALVVVTTIFFTGAYNVGMDVWENEPQPLYHSIEIVIQSFTTTGYGEDAPWQTPQMHLLVILMQLAGIGLILTAVDILAVPWLRDALTPTAPTSVSRLDDHVVLCSYTPQTDAFITELDARGRDYVLVEPDSETAHDLHEAGYHVIHGDPESIDTLSNARVESALALVADAADDTTASIVLAARDVRPDIRIITLVEDATLAPYHLTAGADDVLSPRQLLGESLATKVPTTVSITVDESVELGEHFELTELTVAEESDLHGQTFGDARVRERYGVNVVGAWFDGDFRMPVGPDDELVTGTRLLVVGGEEQVERLREAAASTARRFTTQRVLVAGYGDSGRAADEVLSRAGSHVSVLDIEADDGVDVAGDARAPSVLQEAGIEDVSTLLVTVGDDTTAIFITLIARELNPDLQILVRANDEADVPKLYRAGANYVQSLATVSGRMLASTVFDDEEVYAHDEQISAVRLSAPGLTGRTLAGASVRSVTGCTVVAVIRDGEPVVSFDPAEFTFARSDEVIVVGAEDDIADFSRRFGE